jgi:hypothetical protein
MDAEPAATDTGAEGALPSIPAGAPILPSHPRRSVTEHLYGNPDEESIANKNNLKFEDIDIDEIGVQSSEEQNFPWWTFFGALLSASAWVPISILVMAVLSLFASIGISGCIFLAVVTGFGGCNRKKVYFGKINEFLAGWGIAATGELTDDLTEVVGKDGYAQMDQSPSQQPLVKEAQGASPSKTQVGKKGGRHALKPRGGCEIICGCFILCIAVLVIVGPFCALVIGPTFFHWKNTVELQHAVRVKFDTTPPREVCTVRLTGVAWSPSSGMLAVRSIGNIRRICADDERVQVCDWAILYPAVGYPASLFADPCAVYRPTPNILKERSLRPQIADGARANESRLLKGPEHGPRDTVCAYSPRPPGLWWTDILVYFVGGTYCIEWHGDELDEVCSWSLPSLFTGELVCGPVDSLSISTSPIPIWRLVMGRERPTKEAVLRFFGLPPETKESVIEQDLAYSRLMFNNRKCVEPEALKNMTHIDDLVQFEREVRQMCSTSSYDTYAVFLWTGVFLWLIISARLTLSLSNTDLIQSGPLHMMTRLESNFKSKFFLNEDKSIIEWFDRVTQIQMSNAEDAGEMLVYDKEMLVLSQDKIKDVENPDDQSPTRRAAEQTTGFGEQKLSSLPLERVKIRTLFKIRPDFPRRLVRLRRKILFYSNYTILMFGPVAKPAALARREDDNVAGETPEEMIARLRDRPEQVIKAGEYDPAIEAKQQKWDDDNVAGETPEEKIARLEGRPEQAHRMIQLVESYTVPTDKYGAVFEVFNVTIFVSLFHIFVPPVIRYFKDDNMFGTSKGTVITMCSNAVFYPFILQFISMVLKEFKMICLKLENFDKLTVDLNKKKMKGRTEEQIKNSYGNLGAYETSKYDLDLDGSLVLNTDRVDSTISAEDVGALRLPEGMDGLSILEINLRSWISMRDLLKRECMAQSPMIESVLVLTLLIPVLFLLCVAHEVYVRNDAWLTTFNSVAVLHIIVFLTFAVEALLSCVDANAFFDSHNDKIAKNKESFLRRRRPDGPEDGKTPEEATQIMTKRVETYVKYLHISNVMDTMIQKIETKDVPITLLGIKVNRSLQEKALWVGASYIFTICCIIGQRFDAVNEFEKSFGVDV